MTEKRLDNCSLLHVHKELLDDMNLVDVAIDFVSCTDKRVRYFGGPVHLLFWILRANGIRAAC